MRNESNANKIVHSSAIYLQNMNITRSLCKKLLTIKSVKFFLEKTITYIPTIRDSEKHKNFKKKMVHTQIICSLT